MIDAEGEGGLIGRRGGGEEGRRGGGEEGWIGGWGVGGRRNDSLRVYGVTSGWIYLVLFLQLRKAVLPK